MVLALDYGLIREVTAEQMYRPCMSLLHIKSMTTLCSIKGSLDSANYLFIY